MSGSAGLQSIFSQKLDRALFATYFLGAIVPLLALGYLADRFALPAVDGDPLATWLILGTGVGISILSLAAFFALRRLSLSAVQRMDADNDRLAAMLTASRDLAAAPHMHAAAEVAAHCALSLCWAELAMVVRRPDSRKPFELCESSGEGAEICFDSNLDEIQALAELAIDTGAATPRSPLGDGVAIALPMITEDSVPGAMVVVAGAAAATSRLAFDSAEVDALATLAGLSAVAAQGAELKDSQRNFFTHATEIMVTALDAHAGRRGGGCHRVAQIANRIGRELELEEDVLRGLHFAALLSDIGMLKLTPAQQKSAQHVMRHPVIGHRILSQIRLWEPMARIVLHHHDAYDGGGAEDACRGDAIPVESRIIHAADAWACLTDGGQRVERLTAAGALERLSADSGKRFDPAVIGALVALHERGEIDVEL
jgi:hypothetical protein